ncbi:uncharacterized protein TNCV_958991 [Trichonephila clavipes]|nr:uncharacterized protein TNCV_958991 [Trichonephila clavipes]
MELRRIIVLLHVIGCIWHTAVAEWEVVVRFYGRHGLQFSYHWCSLPMGPSQRIATLRRGDCINGHVCSFTSCLYFGGHHTSAMRALSHSTVPLIMLYSPRNTL